MEEYPSLVEGTGLENQQVVRAALGFESLFLRHLILLIAGWSSLVARRAHNPKVVGSNPAPATTKQVEFFKFNLLFCVHIKVGCAAAVAHCAA